MKLQKILNSRVLLVLCSLGFLGANSGLAMAQSTKMEPKGNVVRLPTEAKKTDTGTNAKKNLPISDQAAGGVLSGGVVSKKKN